ncbi:MAG: sodium:calcium antiporter [Dehalococcoidia bacterium]
MVEIGKHPIGFIVWQTSSHGAKYPPYHLRIVFGPSLIVQYRRKTIDYPGPFKQQRPLSGLVQKPVQLSSRYHFDSFRDARHVRPPRRPTRSIIGYRIPSATPGGPTNMDLVIALLLFAGGVVLAVWATERLIEGLVGLALLLGLSTFIVGVLLSGLEAENIAVGLAGAHAGSPAIALGSVLGGSIFDVCVALGLGGIIAPLQVRLPLPFLLLVGLAPLLVGLPLLSSTTPRLSGVVLLLAFAMIMGYLVVASRRQPLMESEEVEEAAEEQHHPAMIIILTLFGLAAVSIGGELITQGANRLIVHLGVPALLMGMVVTPAAIELEEVIRQVVPARAGHPEISAGNILGTLLYFTLCNLGIIALVAPVHVPPLARTLDWPFLVAVTWLALFFLWRSRVGRPQGAALLAAYVAYLVLHIILR